MERAAASNSWVTCILVGCAGILTWLRRVSILPPASLFSIRKATNATGALLYACACRLCHDKVTTLGGKRLANHQTSERPACLPWNYQPKEKGKNRRPRIRSSHRLAVGIPGWRRRKGLMGTKGPLRTTTGHRHSHCKGAKRWCGWVNRSGQSPPRKTRSFQRRNGGCDCGPAKGIKKRYWR